MSTVLLTGVGRQGQVGEVVARAFAAQGSSVILVDRTPAEVQARASELVRDGYKATAYGCDLSRPDEVDALGLRIREVHGARIDGLVLLAGGFAMTGPVESSVPEEWERQFTINLRTAYLSVRSFLPMVRAARGSIVFFASAAAVSGAKLTGMSAYTASKSGVVTLMQSVAQQERDTGVRANALAPVAIRTSANVSAMGGEIRYVEREDVAAIVMFLCSPAARAISGQLIRLE